MAGANPAAEVTGQALLFGTSNYFIGNDPSRWMTNVPVHGGVCYRDIYPGVDLMYYGVQRQLEYDFMVAPGVDPSLITLDFEGVNNLSVTPAGDLLIKTASGEIRQRKPFVYQEMEGGKREVGGCYVCAGEQRVSFEVGAYDSRHPLIIDPVLAYSTYLGGTGTGFDAGNGIAVDGYGNAYITGRTDSADFPTTPNALQASDPDLVNSDVFVAKLNSAGSALVYSTYLGGTGIDIGNAIAVDHESNAYVTGQTTSRNFPTTSDAFQAGDPDPRSTDAFVMRFRNMTVPVGGSITTAGPPPGSTDR
jgi:hypothetical protein